MSYTSPSVDAFDDIPNGEFGYIKLPVLPVGQHNFLIHQVLYQVTRKRLKMFKVQGTVDGKVLSEFIFMENPQFDGMLPKDLNALVCAGSGVAYKNWKQFFEDNKLVTKKEAARITKPDQPLRGKWILVEAYLDKKGSGKVYTRVIDRGVPTPGVTLDNFPDPTTDVVHEAPAQAAQTPPAVPQVAKAQAPTWPPAGWELHPENPDYAMRMNADQTAWEMKTKADFGL